MQQSQQDAQQLEHQLNPGWRTDDPFGLKATDDLQQQKAAFCFQRVEHLQRLPLL